MKQALKDADAKREHDVEVRRYLTDGFNSLMDKLNQKGFDKMVREGFIVADETEYQV